MTPHFRAATRWVAVAVCLGAAAAILFVLKVGPILWTVSATHGVHTGDALALLPAAAAVLLMRPSKSSGVQR